MKLPSTRTLAMIAVAVILLIAFLWLNSCRSEREATRRAELQEKAREADARAAESRQQDQARIEADRQEITNALNAMADEPLSDRQRVRYCSVYAKQNPGATCPATQ
jgi:heme exporter protein D